MKARFFFIPIAIALLSACSGYLPEEPRQGVPPMGFVANTTVPRSETVTQSDLERLVASFSAEMQRPATRSVEMKYSVETIADGNGNPAIYVVNFDNDKGFILVSATKKMNPVLAFSERGKFVTQGEMPGGLKMWRDEAVRLIANAGLLPADTIEKHRAMWRRYEEPLPVVFPQQARPLYTDPELEDMKMKAQTILQDSVSMWSARGWRVASVQDAFPNEDLWPIIEGAIYPLYQDDWERLTIAVEKVYVWENRKSDCLQSTWGQDYGYNTAFPPIGLFNPQAGCVTVAMGQIMRYHQHPARYNWADMPLKSPTETTSKFLYDIALAANAEFGVDGTTIDSSHVPDVFRNFGYSCSDLVSYDYDRVRQNIFYGSPVYMRAGIENANAGHAWVASGYLERHESSVWEVFTFTEQSRCRSVHRGKTDDFYYPNKIYMNWGWYGYSDGFYSDLNFEIPGHGTATGRQAIYDITPIK